MKVIGIISDTHSLLRPEAIERLRGSQLVLHAGDVGDPAILAALERLAPVVAVRGNNDRGPWARRLRNREILLVESVRICVIHEIALLDRDEATERFDAVVSGHSHRPAVERRDGILWVNPGSAGPRRFRLPVSVARLVVRPGHIEAEILELDVAAARRPVGRAR